jgi:transcriptional regulator with XRE-family HTH domain
MTFGDHVRRRREALRETNPAYSIRRVAASIDLEPSYLSKIERDEQPPPSEEKIVALAHALGEDPDYLLALAGKIASDLQEIVRRRPLLFAALIRELRAAPDETVRALARRVREGEW